MGELGQGWYNLVYDLGNKKVLKKKTSFFRQYLYIRRAKIRKHKSYNFIIILKEISKVNELHEKSNHHIKKILQKMDGEIFGNPIFINNDDYIQDKVQPINKIIKSCSKRKAKRIINQYIALIHKTWQYGFSEKIYNFLGNNGIDCKGNLIQLDFGELTFNKKLIAKKIKNKKWLETTSFKKFPNGYKKEYYCKQMDKRISIENLNNLWKTKI